MNMDIEKPSSILRLHVAATEGHKKDLGRTVDFYSTDTEMPRVSEKPQGWYIGNELLKDAIKIKMNQKQARWSHDSPDTNILGAKFYTEALKNDIRVKVFVVEDDSVIVVHFNTIEDAISFRMQYAEVVRMQFLKDIIFDLPDQRFSGNPECELRYSIKKEQECIPGDMHDLKPFSSKHESEKSACLTESEFYSRIEFFSKMKSLYSKTESHNICSKLEGSSKNRLEYLIAHSKVLAVGSTTNTIMQGLIKEMSEDELCELIGSIGDDIAAISATKYGAYSIQVLILACSTERTQMLLCKCFGENGKYLFSHEIGNYSIQRILLFNEEYVVGLIKMNLRSIIESKLGIKVLRRCMKLLKSRRGEIEVEMAKICGKEGGYDEIFPAIS